MPIAIMNESADDPPEEIISNGTPVKGIIPVTPPTLNNVCASRYAAVPTRKILARSERILNAYMKHFTSMIP